jgi:hypothetical protein
VQLTSRSVSVKVLVTTRTAVQYAKALAGLAVNFPRFGGHQVKPEVTFRLEVSNESQAQEVYP